MEYQRDDHHVYLLNYHLIWCPKRRKPVLVGQVKEQLDKVIRQKAKELKINILGFEIMPDHIHLFVSACPTMPIHKIVKEFKGISSYILRKKFRHLLKLTSLWTHSYFASTADNVSNQKIRRYIEAQSKT
ncbi:MAG: IS200/IS605 family transposase [Ignavibacteriales bacterium]